MEIILVAANDNHGMGEFIVECAAAQSVPSPRQQEDA